MNTENFDLKQALHPNRILSLWRLMRGYHVVYFAAILAVMLSTIAQTGSSYLLLYFVDHILPRPDFYALVPWVALGFIGLALIQGLFTYFSGRWSAHTAESITRRLRNYLYDHLQRLTFTYHDQTQTGELIQRASSDVDAIRMFYSEQAIGSGRILMLFLVNWVGILYLNLYLGLMSVIAIPVVVIVSIYFFKKVGAVFERFQEQEAVLSNRFQENVTGVRVVKAFARQEYEIERFTAENNKLYNRGSMFGLMHGTFWPTTDIICAFQMLFGFYLGAIMAINGEITVGTYMAYAGMVVQIIWPIRNLGRLMTQMSTAVVSFGRLSDIINQTREPLDEGNYRPTSIQGQVRFNQVGFAYTSAVENQDVTKANTVGALGRENRGYKHGDKVLHDISFTVEPGKTIALLGSTGSGKSSLVNLLPRFYDYTEGEILLDGRPLTDYPRTFLREQIGIVQQEAFLFSRTIRENITYGVSREVSDEEVHTAAKAAAAHDFIQSFPDGYNTIVGERGVTLSGGQKQRVALARTFLKNPRILILDDSTSAVDTETESQIRDALERLMQNRTTFIIAHRIQSVMTADMVLVLDKGRIVQQGTHEQLVAQEGIYQQTYTLQAQIEDELQAEIAGLNGNAERPNVSANGKNGHSAPEKTAVSSAD